MAPSRHVASTAVGGLVLDVGANFGYYALYAATLGCRVVAWEPVPTFRAFLRLGAALNNVSHRLHVRDAIVSNASGNEMTICVPERGIWGTASVGCLNVDPSYKSGRYEVKVRRRRRFATPPPSVNIAPTGLPAQVRTETLDDVLLSRLGERPCALKLDVEGYEPYVVRGAKGLLSSLPPRAVLTEYTPGAAERLSGWGGGRLREYPASLRAFKSAGYRMWHLASTRKGERTKGMRSGDWRTVPLPPLREVTTATVRAEEKNAENMIDDMKTTGSFAVPWDIHPRSLHAEFSHNTDLLLTLDADAIASDGEVGVRADSPFGLGGGLCEHTLRDGTAKEMVGRLCVGRGRNASIEAAVRTAEAPRPLAPKQSRHSQVNQEARKWKIAEVDGVRQLLDVDADVPELGSDKRRRGQGRHRRGRGRGGRGGRGRGEG